MPSVSPNIDHLHYFTTVVETHSFTAAARKLKRDRSSIGQAIANLELDLGLTLFHRNGRTIALTEEGEALYIKARTVLEAYQSFCQYSQNLSSQTETALTIGIDSFTSLADIARIDTAIANAYPTTKIYWHRGPTDELDTLLDSGRIDINIRLFQNRNLPETFHIRHIDNIELNCYINSALSESLSDELIHQAIRQYPLVAYPDIDKALRLDRFEYSQHLFSVEAALAIVAIKPAWTLAEPQHAEQYKHQINKRSIETDDPLIIRRIIVWHHSHAMGQVKRWLIQQVQTLLKESQ